MNCFLFSLLFPLHHSVMFSWTNILSLRESLRSHRCIWRHRGQALWCEQHAGGSQRLEVGLVMHSVLSLYPCSENTSNPSLFWALNWPWDEAAVWVSLEGGQLAVKEGIGYPKQCSWSCPFICCPLTQNDLFLGAVLQLVNVLRGAGWTTSPFSPSSIVLTLIFKAVQKAPTNINIRQRILQIPCSQSTHMI